MARVVVNEYVSVDGVMEDPGGAEGFELGGWTRPYWSDELGRVQLERLLASDALLLGRVTYGGFAAAWPAMKDEAGFADKMNGMAKYVASRTLTKLAWNNSRLIEGDVAAAVAELKRRPGGDLMVAGSATLLRTLIRHDLVDEYRLMVHPVALGKGKRLFAEGANTSLVPVETRTLDKGVVLLVYRPGSAR
jgi:dihydrofolate reductase